MFKSIYYLVFFLFVMISQAIAADKVALNNDEFPGLKATETKTYDGGSLWGYMDGGADLYLEYGFQKLTSQAVTCNDITFQVDIFEMNNPLSAFGIYSVNRFRCRVGSDTLVSNDCLNAYQYQIVAGKYYINIVNQVGSSKATETSLQIGQVFEQKLKEQPEVTFPNEIKKNLSADNRMKLKLMMGRLGVQNGYSSWADFLSGWEHYQLWMLPVQGKNLLVLTWNSGVMPPKFKALIEARSESNLPKSIASKDYKLEGDQLIVWEN
ncbi:DUF6599 family protein [Prolixibacter denitrificans]|uniref:Uncharacterized protein n=1 Tax=Prolixibacter denitrificans TaxID=1541063 RepID=A0A2P8CCX1_9BACT|nr:DUF6599 family protein [Prolixibacter denitrificans]PSK82826.1 hypothetical protein CLV93_105220 [Prolixibacter denitrificans]GET21359.1 hypothetical protein JCM18694_16050 [Prolixibacter denitrificans]